MTTEPVPAGITEKRPFLRFAEKRKTGRKSVFFPKKLPKFAKRLIFIGEKGTFSFPQLLPVVARTWLGPKSELFFLARKIRISARKSVWDPVFCQRDVRSPRRWLRFGTFGSSLRLVPSYARFREGNPADAPKRLPPPHCGGTVCQ